MNLLITGAWRFTPEQLETIRSMGHTLYFLPDEKEMLPLPYEAVEGVICNGLFQYHPIEKFTALRYIQLTSAGLDRVPVDYVEGKGILLHNARDVYSVPMAEFALAGVLQLYKQAAFFRNNQKQHLWNKNRSLLELQGKTVCILGCGDVGKECAKRFRAFGCRVIGVNRSLRDDPVFDEMYPLSDLSKGLLQADVVVVAIALTPQTRQLLSAEALSVLKKGCVLVNIARGPVVDSDALLYRLKKGELLAVLDVFDQEPLPADSELWDLDNVILTPHNSFVGDHNADRMWRVCKENLLRLSRRGSYECT